MIFVKLNSIKRPIYHLTKLLPHTLIRFISPPKLQLSEQFKLLYVFVLTGVYMYYVILHKTAICFLTRTTSYRKHTLKRHFKILRGWINSVLGI